jgi:hypothetical protein
LLYWEGKGELDGDWIHKSLAEWLEETELTESMIRTARRVGKAEQLWEEKDHLRSDNRWVTKYRLNLWRVLQVTNASEIENIEMRLGRSRNNPTKRDALQREFEKLKATRDDLNLIDAEDGLTHGQDAARANVTAYSCEYRRGMQSICTDYRGVPQTNTSEDILGKNSPEGTRASPASHSTPSSPVSIDGCATTTEDNEGSGSGSSHSRTEGRSGE